MAQTDLLKRYLDAGVAFTQLSQKKAEDLVRELVRVGEVQTGQAQQRVEELLKQSRQNTEALIEVVRAEVKNQVGKLGLVNRAELEKAVRKVTSPAGRGTKQATAARAVQKVAATAGTPKKPDTATAKKAAPKKSATKAAPKKATTKKTGPSKATATKKA